MGKRAPDLRSLNVDACFLVEDVPGSASHYRDVLGFEIRQTWGDPPRFALVSRGPIEVLFTQGTVSGPFRTDEMDVTRAGWDAFIRVSDVDALATELIGRGANILRGPEVSFYGLKELHVQDCNGFVVCFAEDPARPTSGAETV